MALKGVLVARLEEAVRSNAMSDVAPSAATTAIAATTATAAALEDKTAHITGLKVSELKDALRAKGLRISGRKAELQARLLEANGCTAATSDVPESAVAQKRAHDTDPPTSGSRTKRAKTEQAPPAAACDGLLRVVDRTIGRANAADAVRRYAATLSSDQLRWELHYAESRHECDGPEYAPHREYDYYKENALLRACRSGDSDLVRLLLYLGADMRLSSYSTDWEGYGSTATPLGVVKARLSNWGRFGERAKITDGMTDEGLRAAVRAQRRKKAQLEVTLQLLEAAAEFYPVEHRIEGHGSSG